MIDTSQGFTLTRILEASPQALFAAWTDPDQAAQWWHPAGLVTPRDTVAIDARVRGEYRYTMVDERSGERYPTFGVYREVEAPRRLVFTWGNEADADDDRPLITLTFEDFDGLTRLTFDLRGWSGFSGDGSVWDGWESALDELAQFVGGGHPVG